MEAHQQTLDNFIKSRKRPTNDDDLHKKITNTVGINKPSRKLSFDDSAQQNIKKQKVSLFC